MTGLHKAAQQALVAMQEIEPYADRLIDYTSTAAQHPLNNAPKHVEAAITALREALAKPAVPPYVVAKDSYDKVDRFLRNNLDDEDYAEYSAALDDVLYAAGPQPKDTP